MQEIKEDTIYAIVECHCQSSGLVWLVDRDSGDCFMVAMETLEHHFDVTVAPGWLKEAKIK